MNFDSAGSSLNVLAFLQLVGQILVLIKLKKRTNAGLVYDSTTRKPVDLATVRLVSEETGQPLQSKVTDSEGRYSFVVSPGSYQIQVLKNGFIFPTRALKDLKNDGPCLNIYHGGTLVSSVGNTEIALNIPLDPVGESRVSKTRLYAQRAADRLQIIFPWFGLAIIISALVVAFSWITLVLLPVQFIVIAYLNNLALRPKFKRFGIVTDFQTGVPVGQVMVRLFTAEESRLVASQVTDNDGKYSFLPAVGRYYITLEHPRYEIKKSEILDLTKSKSRIVALDVTLALKS